MQKKISIFLFALFYSLVIFTYFATAFIFPAGFLNDELIYAFSGLSYFLNGTDISGVGFPMSLFKTGTEGFISPVTPILTSLFYGIFGLTFETIRIPVILVGILNAILIYFLAKHLFSRKMIGVFASLAFLISPWAYFLSHTAYEVNFVLFFYLLGIYLILISKNKNIKKLYLGLFILIIGFFTYHGAKFPFLPLLFIISAYKYIENKVHKKHLIAILFIGILVFTSYYAIGKTIPDSIVNSRESTILLLNTDSFSSFVDEERKNTIQSPLMPILSNKITHVFSLSLAKYFGAFSPNLLFINGDAGAVYSYYYFGLFYAFDALMIIAGTIYLAVKKRKSLFLIIAIILIAPISSVFSTIGTTYINRSFLLLPMFIFLIAAGYYVFYSFLRKRFGLLLPVIIILLIFSLNFFRFSYFYSLRYPVVGQENHFLSQRIVAKYLHSESPETKIKVISNKSVNMYLNYLLFAPSKEQRNALKENKNIYADENINFKNIEFSDDCPKKFDRSSIYIIHKDKTDCKGEYFSYNIIDIKETTSLFKIYNGSLCQRVKLSPWRGKSLISDYLIEGMDKESFCKRWLFK